MSSISVAPKLTFCTILKNSTKTNIILTFCSLVKIHLEKSQKNFVTRLRRKCRGPRTCLTSAMILPIFFPPYDLRARIYRKVLPRSWRTIFLRSFKQKMLVAPVALTNLTKHTIEPQCRCSCEIGGTSAVALLVIHETCVETS